LGIENNNFIPDPEIAEIGSGSFFWGHFIPGLGIEKTPLIHVPGIA